MPHQPFRNLPAQLTASSTARHAVRAANARPLAGADAAPLHELTRLYLNAVEGQRTKEGLLAVAAHELRHPLHLMRMSLERHIPDKDSPAREGLERYINRMSRLIDDLIDFIRLERDSLDIQREWIELDPLLLELVDEYGSTFQARGVRLTLNTSNHGVWISADAQRLIQVFSNLLDNALKFTPAGGAVDVTVDQHATTVDVRVRDTGRGVAPDILHRILDFPGNVDGRDGLGIGLSVARRIAELHGGTIALRSDGPGRGTEVVVTLPAVDAAGPAAGME